MRASRLHIFAPHRAAWLVALAFAVLAPPARAQFGPDFRLTGPPFFVSQTARNHAWSVATDDLGNVHVVYFDARNGPLGDIPPYYRRYDLASHTWGPRCGCPPGRRRTRAMSRSPPIATTRCTWCG